MKKTFFSRFFLISFFLLLTGCRPKTIEIATAPPEVSTADILPAQSTPPAETAPSADPIPIVTVEETTARVFTPVNDVVYTVKLTYVLTTPDLNAPEDCYLGSVDQGTAFGRVAYTDGWSEVSYDGQTAYILSDCVTTTPPVHTISQEELESIADTYSSTVEGFDGYTGTKDEYNRSRNVLNVQQRLEFEDHFNATFLGGVDSNTIYLTFPMGWENGTNTTEVLDILDQKGVSAVFYMNHEYASNNPEIVNRIINEGHQIGSHGYEHPDNGIASKSLDFQMEDAMRMQDYMKSTYNYTLQKYNFNSSYWSEQSVALMSTMGYEVCFYSFNYSDYDVNASLSGEEVHKMLIEAIHPGAIYYLHTVSDGNVAALGSFIDDARAQGYVFGILN